MIDLDPLLHNIRTTLARHKIAPGKYTRFTLGSNQPNPYGCADAANILYSLGDFPAEPEEHAEAVRILQDFQDPATGMFHDIPEQGFYSHHQDHTTAHCTAALELLDAPPRHPLTETKKYLDFSKMEQLLDSLD